MDMDPITAAIAAALGSGALKAVGGVAQQAVVDAYNGLKALLHRKFGDHRELHEAVSSLEARPDSEARRAVLGETMSDAKVADDPELVAAAKAVLEKVGAVPGGLQVVQQVFGSTNVAQSAGSGTATVDVHYGPTPGQG